MKRILLAFSITLVLLLTGAPNAIASSVIFFDPFEVEPALNGWSTVGEVLLRNHNDFGNPAGDDPVVRLRGIGIDDVVTMERTISTAGYTDLEVAYYRLGHDLNHGDVFEARWRLTGESDWVTLESITKNDPWSLEHWLLPTTASNSSIDVQFYLKNVHGATGRGFVENFVVGGNVVPEPATLALLLPGAIGAFFARRRK